MKNETLNWPSGDFSHTDFANFNNKTNQAVWTVWSESKKNGTIVFVGDKKKDGGRGKPTKIYRLNDGTMATPPVVIVKTEPVVTPAVETKVVEVAKVETVKLPEVQPATPPLTVEVLRVEKPTVTNELVTVIAHNLSRDVRTLKCGCPVCNNPLLAMDDATGVKVWCGQDSTVCYPQDVSFHGRNDKDALEGLLDRWTGLLKK